MRLPSANTLRCARANGGPCRIGLSGSPSRSSRARRSSVFGPHGAGPVSRPGSGSARPGIPTPSRVNTTPTTALATMTATPIPPVIQRVRREGRAHPGPLPLVEAMRESFRTDKEERVSFFDKVKKGAGQVADKAKTEVSEAQTKNELVKTYEVLGKKTYELVDKGELEHKELKEIVAKVKELRVKLEQLQVS